MAARTPGRGKECRRQANSPVTSLCTRSPLADDEPLGPRESPDRPLAPHRKETRMYSWNFHVIWEYRIVFLQGALITVELTLLSVVFALGLGLLVGMARLSKSALVSAPAE